MDDPRSSRVVIVGASAAGMATAAALRRRGHEGSIVVIGAEPHLPYDRPPLSKQYQTDGWEHERIHLLPGTRLAGLDLDLRLGTKAVELDLGAKDVLTDDGARHPYDDLVIATGIAPRRLPQLAEVAALELRTLDDAARIKTSVRPGLTLAVVGAGFIGLETAATARTIGAEAIVIEPVLDPLATRIGADSAARLIDLHRRHGVTFHTGVGVERAVRTDSGVTLSLSDGREVAADQVLVSVGSVACTDWLISSGIDISNGVLCDEFSRVVPGVWAAGDVARWFHLFYGDHVRIEHRTNATEQGQQVAAGILGQLSPYTPVPFFWTDHYDVRVQVAGRISPEATETHVPVEGRGESFLKLFHERGRLSAVLAWNAPRALLPYRRELATTLNTEAMTT